MSIRQAAELLNINYSSAKAILSSHKKAHIFTPRKITSKLASKAASFKHIQDHTESNGIQSLCCSVGGLVVSEHEFKMGKRKLIRKERKEKRETEDEENGQGWEKEMEE